jgi:PAS domain S-box-containing protein
MGPEAEALRLRRALRDLVALSTVPAAWVGREPPAIAAGLADVLVNSLHLDFAFVRLCDPNGSAAVEITRGSAWQAFPEWLQYHLSVNGRLSRREIVRDIGNDVQRCRGIVIPIGVNAEGGVVAAACNDADFPTEIDQLLLSVAANHAATAFRTARIEEAIRASEQQLRKARDELETKVAERTAELQRSEAYLAEAQRLSHTGSFGWDVSSEKLYWSEETYRIFECDRANQPTMEFVLQRTHPDDRACVQQTIDRAAQQGRNFDFEHRLLMPDGSTKHVHVVGHAAKKGQSGRLEFLGAITDITARKYAEGILRRSEAYLSEAQRLSHTGSWASNPAIGKHTYWSEEIFRIMGFDPAGGPPRFEEFERRVHPDDRARTKEHFRAAIREKIDFDHNYRIVLPGGEVREIHAIGHPVFGPSGDLVEFVGTLMDVTERRRAEEILRRSEAYLSEAQRLSHTGSWAAIPATGEHTYFSEEAFRILGFDPVGRPPRFEELERRFHPADRARTTEHFKAAIRERTDFDVIYRIVYPGGEIREIQSIGHPVIGPSGNVVEFVGTVMDVTERRRAEEERQALAHANRITAMGQLTASIAHEVNQPIAAVVTNAQAALRWLNMRPSDPQEVGQALDRIVRNGRLAGDVIGRIRALVAKAAPRKDRLDLNDTIREVIALTRGELHSSGTSLQTQLADGLPLILGDRIQLQQVMLNLILNAIEAMSGSRAGSRELLIKTEQDGPRGVLVAIQDSGPGLNSESVDRLFDAFYTTKSDGMGMGLSICRSIIEAHGGRVWATANVPKGAILQFTLPLQGETSSYAVISGRD